MIHRSSLAVGASSLLLALLCAPSASAQPAPNGAQPAPTTVLPPPPPTTAPPGGTWGAGLPGTPAPYPTQAPGYGPGALPPPPSAIAPAGSAPPPNTPPPNNPPPNGQGPNRGPGAPPNGLQGPYPQDPYQPGTLWLSNKNDPMIMGGDGALHQLPLEMPYDKDKGIPAGYKMFERPRLKLTAVGASILAGLWLGSCVAGGFMQAEADRESSYYYGGYPSNQQRAGWPMFLPIVGPFISIGTFHTDGGGTGALIVDGIAQAAMGGLALMGLFMQEKVLKFQFQKSEVAFAPMASPTNGGGFAGFVASF